DAYSRQTGPDRLPMERARRQVCGVRARPPCGGFLPRSPSDLALSRRAGHVRQLGGVARQLPPTDSRAQEKLTDHAASCEGRWQWLEPYEALSFTYGS